MTDRDAFKGPSRAGTINRSAAEDGKYQQFIDRTIKRHPDLKGLKSSSDNKRG